MASDTTAVLRTKPEAIDRRVPIVIDALVGRAQVLEWLEHHPGLGSWVQAVGTAGALWFALVQLTATRRVQRQRYRAMLRAVEAILYIMKDRTEFCERTIANEVSKDDWSEVFSAARTILPDSGLDTAIISLRAINLHEIDDWLVVSSLIEIASYATKFKMHLEDLADGRKSSNPMALRVALRGIEQNSKFVAAARRGADEGGMMKLLAFLKRVVHTTTRHHSFKST